MSHVEFETDDEDAGERLDKVIAHHTGVSRAGVAELFSQSAVRVDGELARKTDRPRPGQLVAAEIEEVTTKPLEPQKLRLDIKFEDADFAVISKEVGVAVHPGSGRPDGTIANAVIERWPAAVDVGQPNRPGIVHRLDVDTSGLMLIALSHRGYDLLVKALKGREVSREYLALISGVPRPPSGAVDAPVGRDPRHRTRMAVTAGGREARTHYEVVSTWSLGAALVAVRLETGRTHQIRVHMTEIGHPVLGDPNYGGPARVDGLSESIARPMLHASRLAFAHPVTGAPMSFTDPPPDDFASLLTVFSEAGTSTISGVKSRPESRPEGMGSS